MTKSDIETFAKEILREHGINSIPVDPVILASKLGIRVTSAVFSNKSLSGMIGKRGNNVTLLVNEYDSINWKRFTIAHALGHFLLHLRFTDKGEFVDNQLDFFRTEASDGSLKQEVGANQFAAALLMDADVIKRYWSEINDLKILSNIFQVSQDFIGCRLSNLNREIRSK